MPDGDVVLCLTHLCDIKPVWSCTCIKLYYFIQVINDLRINWSTQFFPINPILHVNTLTCILTLSYWSLRVWYAGAVLGGGGCRGVQCPPVNKLGPPLAPLNLESYYSKQVWVKCAVCPVNYMYIIRKISPAAKFKSAFTETQRF